jgi:hypothetical protein
VAAWKTCALKKLPNQPLAHQLQPARLLAGRAGSGIKKPVSASGKLAGQAGRKFIYYCEEVQYHNLNTPEHLTNQYAGDFPSSENHPHGVTMTRQRAARE